MRFNLLACLAVAALAASSTKAAKKHRVACQSDDSNGSNGSTGSRSSDGSQGPPTVGTCTLSGTYSNTTDLSACSDILISSLNVPAGVTLDLTNVKSGASIKFTGTTTFGTQLWSGPLVLLKGENLKVSGPGTLDGQGEWYWKQGQKVTRPVFFRLSHVNSSMLTGFTIKNSPFRAFSIQHSRSTALTRLTLDSSAGNGLAKNTDGFDLSYNNGVAITKNVVYNQDDCLAMQSSVNTLFSENTCSGGHGISVGSIGGAVADDSDTVQGLTVRNNKIINNVNGLRIKTSIGLTGSVSDVPYIDNELVNVTNAIVMHSDYDKAKGGYTGSPTSNVAIKDITIAGLSGTATFLYDVLVNPNVVSGWKWSDITVTTSSSSGTCVGQQSDVQCA